MTNCRFAALPLSQSKGRKWTNRGPLAAYTDEVYLRTHAVRLMRNPGSGLREQPNMHSIDAFILFQSCALLEAGLRVLRYRYWLSAEHDRPLHYRAKMAGNVDPRVFRMKILPQYPTLRGLRQDYTPLSLDKLTQEAPWIGKMWCPGVDRPVPSKYRAQARHFQRVGESLHNVMKASAQYELPITLYSCS